MRKQKSLSKLSQHYLDQNNLPDDIDTRRMLKEILYTAGVSLEEIRLMDLDGLITTVLEYENYNK